MNIPKKFQLMGRTITVALDTGVMKDWNGFALTDKDIIILSDGLHREKMEHVFLHEVTHTVLAIMNQSELCEDEAFVNTFSGLLHQILTTQKGTLV